MSWLNCSRFVFPAEKLGVPDAEDARAYGERQCIEFGDFNLLAKMEMICIFHLWC
jgi:hypothetical protein